jgi:hypothetical protein
MPTTDLEKRKEHLISNIRGKITKEKEVEALIKLINKLILRREAKAQKAQTAKLKKAQDSTLKTRVPTLTSLQSTNNITQEEALQELTKNNVPWK